MPRVTIPIRAFIGMNPQKGAHMLRIDPENGIIETLELIGVKPQVLPNLEPRKVLARIDRAQGAVTLYPLRQPTA